MKLKPIYQLLLLLVFTLGVYYPTLSAPFNSLDDQALVQVLLNQQDFSFARHFSTAGTHYYFRPIITLSFEIDKYIGGLQEPFMHLFNLLVHALNVVLVWLFARKFGELIGNRTEVAAFSAALLFALHPINTESVNWIMARTDLLAGTFVFLSLICLLNFLRERQLLWGVLGAVTLLLGALCKETALFLVPGACYLLLCRWQPDNRRWRLRWIMPVLYGIAVSIYFMLRWGAFTTDRGLTQTVQFVAHATGAALPSGAGASPAFPWLDAVRVLFKASGYYTVKLFQPLPLNFAIHRLPEFYVLPGIALVVVLAVLLWQRRPLGWLFLTSASLGVSALFVVFTQVAWTPIAERYMYIPSAPFVVGLVFVASHYVERWGLRRFALVLTSLLIVIAAWATGARNLVWQDNLALYQDAVRKSPEFAPAKGHLAAALRAQGRDTEALTLQEQSAEGKGRFDRLSRASSHWRSGDYSAARGGLEQLLLDPGDYEYRTLDMLIKITTAHAQTVTDAKLKQGYYRDVLVWLERISKRWPDGFVFYRIGRIHLILGNRKDAQQAFAESVARFPPDSPYYAPAAKLAKDLVE